MAGNSERAGVGRSPGQARRHPGRVRERPGLHVVRARHAHQPGGVDGPPAAPTDLVRTSLARRSEGQHLPARSLPPGGTAVRSEGGDAARAWAVRRGGSRRRRCTPPHASVWSRASRSPTSRREAGVEPGTLLPNHRTAASARDGHGQGTARLRPTIPEPGHQRLRSSPLHHPERLSCPIDLERALQKVRTHGFALSDRELHPGAGRRRRAGVRRRTDGRSPPIEVDVAQPRPGGGRGRSPPVADGRTLPSPGTHFHRVAATGRSSHTVIRSPRRRLPTRMRA